MFHQSHGVISIGMNSDAGTPKRSYLGKIRKEEKKEEKKSQVMIETQCSCPFFL